MTSACATAPELALCQIRGGFRTIPDTKPDWGRGAKAGSAPYSAPARASATAPELALCQIRGGFRTIPDTKPDWGRGAKAGSAPYSAPEAGARLGSMGLSQRLGSLGLSQVCAWIDP